MVLALMAVLSVMIWGIMRVYSRNYLTNERKISRSQLVRAVAQMLNDDLSDAVQDPIQPFEAGEGAEFVRRFGLRGNSTSIQIDVVQPNPFVIAADTKNTSTGTGITFLNRMPASEETASSLPQVPELKTIFYEFVPMNAREESGKRGQSESGGNSGSEMAGQGITGSLQTPDVGTTPGGGQLALPGMDNRPLVQKYGLSRRELDFETPEGPVEEIPDSTFDAFDNELGGSALVGSLTSTPSLSGSKLLSSDLSNNSMASPDAEDDETNRKERIPMSAAEIAMDTGDGTMWAPEVIDCRFRYYDGKNWLDSWNSIEQSGLPLAIETTMKLMPLDEVDLIRNSPLLLRLKEPGQKEEKAVNEGGLVGSLLDSPGRLAETGNGNVGNGIPADNGLSDGINNMPPLTLDEIIAALSLHSPVVEQVVTWLPTTPLSRHQVLERRKPMTVQRGVVGRNGGNNGNQTARQGRGSADRRARDRVARDRTAQERQGTGRNANGRSAMERATLDRAGAERASLDRVATDRDGNAARTGSGRNARTRVGNDRSVQRRAGNDVPVTADIMAENTSEFATDNVGLGGASELRPESEAVPLATMNDPFFIIDQQTGRDSGVSPVMAPQTGLVQRETGTEMPVQTSRPADTEIQTTKKTSQTWIRGK